MRDRGQGGSLRSSGFFRPGSIFFRIYAWFWLAMALTVVAFLVLTVTAQSGPVFELWRREIGNALALYGQSAVALYEREGTDALAAVAGDLERAEHARIYFLDKALHDLLGRTPPPPAGELVARSRKSGRVEFRFAGGMFLAAQSFTAPGGGRYAVVRQVYRGPLQAVLDQMRALGLKLMIFLILGGTLCYWLARHLAAPIVKLQGAAQKLAAGDLSVRVREAIGRKPYEIAALGEDFDLMAARVEALLQAQRRLLGDISHELRSPLARLGVALEIARRRIGAEANDLLDRIEGEANRLNELIGQLLAVERLEAEMGAGVKELLDLSELTSEIVQDAEFEAQNRGCSVRVVHREPLPVRGAKELLRSAIENVVRNALRHTAPGAAVEISLAREQQGDVSCGVVRVRDHGAGVPEEVLEHLFRPFFRVQDARDRKSGGSGLGLTITERAVRLHGGAVSAANATDGGLIVELRLPLALQQ